MNKQIFRMVADFECKGSKKNRICQVYWGNVHVFVGIIIDNVGVVEILYRCNVEGVKCEGWGIKRTTQPSGWVVLRSISIGKTD